MADRITWGIGRKAACIEYIDYELTQARSARLGLDHQHREWLSQYRPSPKPATKNFPYEGAPLARDTEILTASGWKRVDEISIGESVLTRCDTNEALEWKPVQALPKVFATKLYHFQSRSIDLLVTPEHVMICSPQNGGPTCRIPAKQLWEHTGYYLPQHGKWAGVSHKTLWGLPASDVAELVGWYLSEGGVRYQQNGRYRGGIVISQSKTNVEKCRQIEGLLARLRFNWRYYGHDYVIFHGSIPVGLFDFLAAQRHAAKKRVPRECFTWSTELIERLLTSLIQGDGNITNIAGSSFPKVVYYTVSAGLADDVQVLALLCGLHARIRSRVRVGAGGIIEERKISAKNRCYEVSICASPRAKYDRSYKEIVEYNDVAFCVTVANHAIYARRRGIASWTGNSNYTLPMTATDADQLFAKHIQTIHATPNLWSVEPLNERWKDAAKPLQDWLQTLDTNLLKMYRVNKRAVLEMVKLGTAIYKTGWLYEKRQVWTYDRLGHRQRVQRIVSVPFVDHVRLADFLLPSYSYAIEADEQGGAPWVAERLRVNVARLQSLAQATEPFLPNIDKADLDLIVHFEEGSRPESDVKIEELDYNKRANMGSGSEPGKDFDKDKRDGGAVGASAMLPREIELWEVHTRFPTSTGDSQDDIVLWYHQPTRTVVRGVYAYYQHGHRPYDAIRYFPGDGFWGIGLCEQKEMFQALSSELMNFTIDNVLLANSRMIVAKSGANIAPGEPIYPYKVWLTDGDVRQDFGVFPMADIYQSLPMLQQMVNALGERRTGISDIQLGNLQQLPGRTPATTMLSLLQEGNRRPDLTIKDMRYEGLSTIGLRLVQLCQQFIGSPVDFDGQRWIQMTTDMLGMPEGAILAEKLLTPLESAEFGVDVALTATSGSANKEVARQGALSLLQLAAQVTPQFIQLLQFATQARMQDDQIAANTALHGALGLQELYKRVLEQYDVRNIEDILPLADQLAQAETGGNGFAPGANGAGGTGIGAAGLDPALAALLAGTRGLSGIAIP